jgi:TetR/AcrR family transcriptional regulator, transcriptional repressor of aconitase
MAFAAGVSEALIFRHFPTKQALYDAIVQSGAEGNPELERLLSFQPSTETLVKIVGLLVRHFMIDLPQNARGQLAEHRLLLASLLEDGEFARLRYAWVEHNVQPLFTASVAAAEAAGDLVASPVSARNRFWFAEHLGAMLASLHLSATAIVPYQTDAAGLADQLTWFLLRGIGFTDEKIAAFFHMKSNGIKP